MVSPMPASSSGASPAVEAMRPFEPMPASVSPRCERIVAARGELGVDVDEVADAADLGGKNDLVVAEAVALGGCGRVERAVDHGFDHHVAGGQRIGALAVLVHHAGEQRLIERAPVHADANRFLVLDGALDHGAEIVVVFAADRDVAGIDAVLGQRARRGGILLEQEVAVVVEVADDGHAQAALFEAFDDGWNGGRGVFVVDRDAHDLGAGERERRNLLDGGPDVRRVGVGHRLHDDGNFPAHANVSDFDGWSFSAGDLRHASSLAEFAVLAELAELAVPAELASQRSWRS